MFLPQNDQKEASLLPSFQTPKNESLETHILQLSTLKEHSNLPEYYSNCVYYWESISKLNPLNLSQDEAVSIILYSYDNYGSEQSTNFYFQLNKMLQRREKSELKFWETYLYYLHSALSKIPDSNCIVYRGVVYCDEFEKYYTQGRHILWSAYSSASTSLTRAKGYTKKEGVIFIITVNSGKSIRDYSYIQNEDEILLHPNMSFSVIKPKYQSEDGFSYIELVQLDTNVYIF